MGRPPFVTGDGSSVERAVARVARRNARTRVEMPGAASEHRCEAGNKYGDARAELEPATGRIRRRVAATGLSRHFHRTAGSSPRAACHSAHYKKSKQKS